MAKDLGEYLTGRYAYRVDGKGRFTIPPAWRRVSDDYVLVPQLGEGVIVAYTQAHQISVFEKGLADCLKKDPADERRLAFFDFAEVKVDRSGRVQIPVYILDELGFASGDNLQLRGSGNCFVISLTNKNKGKARKRK